MFFSLLISTSSCTCGGQGSSKIQWNQVTEPLEPQQDIYNSDIAGTLFSYQDTLCNTIPLPSSMIWVCSPSYLYPLASMTNTSKVFYLFIFKGFIYLFLDTGEGREKERERNINVWLPLPRPLLGTWPKTQACAPTGK